MDRRTFLVTGMTAATTAFTSELMGTETALAPAAPPLEAGLFLAQRSAHGREPVGDPLIGTSIGSFCSKATSTSRSPQIWISGSSR